MRIPVWKILILWVAVSSLMTGCGKDRPTRLMGRWYSNDVSIRFRKNGTVLYNSRTTGLVEGRYQYQPAPTSLADSAPKKNLSIWLPQPGRIILLDFELSFLGNERIQLKPTTKPAERSETAELAAGAGIVLKRAGDENQDSDALDQTPPLVSANPN